MSMHLAGVMMAMNPELKVDEAMKKAEKITTDLIRAYDKLYDERYKKREEFEKLVSKDSVVSELKADIEKIQGGIRDTKSDEEYAKLHGIEDNLYKMLDDRKKYLRDLSNL